MNQIEMFSNNELIAALSRINDLEIKCSEFERRAVVAEDEFRALKIKEQNARMRRRQLSTSGEKVDVDSVVEELKALRLNIADKRKTIAHKEVVIEAYKQENENLKFELETYKDKRRIVKSYEIGGRMARI